MMISVVDLHTAVTSIDWVEVLHPTLHKIRHLRDVTVTSKKVKGAVLIGT